jgi:sugar lactone lactonase YvrE
LGEEVAILTRFEPDDVYLVGLVVNGDGSLYVAVLGCVKPELNGVWHVDTQGNPVLEFPMPTAGCGDSIPNALAYDKAGNLHVTESAHGGVWLLGTNGTELWFEDDLLKPRPDSLNQVGVDGIAYRNHSLWVNNLDTGTIVEVPIKRDGLPGQARLFAEGLGHPDGHQFDVDGNLWVTNFGYEDWDTLDFSTRNILRVSPHGDVRVAIPTERLSIVGGTPTPVFGFGRRRSTLFLSSFPISEDPTPSVARVNVGVKGMILPQFEHEGDR